ncbi:hypothetical protein ACS0TY_019564 [Phlomoides rotata]
MRSSSGFHRERNGSCNIDQHLVWGISTLMHWRRRGGLQKTTQLITRMNEYLEDCHSFDRELFSDIVFL